MGIYLGTTSARDLYLPGAVFLMSELEMTM
jgi:hypothetical protein